MKIWNKYTRVQKMDFCKKYKIKKFWEIDFILRNHFKNYTKSTWAVLKKYEIINWVWNFLIPQFLRTFLSYLLPFIRFDIHDLNCSLWWGFREYFRAHWWIIKYWFISIYKHLINWYFLKWIYSILLWVPIIIIAYFIVVLFSWTSFNFVKLK